MADIKDINTELSDLLADFAKGSLSTTPFTDNVLPTPAAPEPAVVEPPVVATPEPVQPTADAVTPTVATPAVPQVDIQKPDEPFSDWDSIPTTPEPVAPTQDAPLAVFSDLGKVLGIEKVNTKEELVQALTTLKAEAEKAKTVAPQGPSELLKAIELANRGGDWADYLKISSVDYSKFDPSQLYEDYVIDSAADEKGQVDFDKVNEYLDGLPDIEKEIRGKDLQRRLIAEQTRKVQEIETEAVRQREKTDVELKSALGGLNEVDGFKVDDRHRKEIFDWITSGRMMRDLFFGANGQLDPAKAARIGFRNLYYDKLDSYQKNKIRNATKREMIAELTNPQITTPPKPTNPIAKTGYDIGDYIKDLETNNFR